MKNKGWIIIANAIIWGFVMIACSLALKGTEAFKEIQFILSGGATMSLIIVGLGIIPFKKKNEDSPNQQSEQ
ncbi:MAG: hypothetical protein P9L92_15545 [Candidatus Electryonea clarkiae]|nr:hypothetical protein [Candidatus Electryonea clarkiae]MDP8288444.1 hypothetical protein [Candidatus Electryonea clarkiae]